MLTSRHGLTQLGLSALVLLLVGCAESHGREGGPDGGGVGDAGAGPGDSGLFVRDGGGGALDAGPRGACDPEDARAVLCPELLCDGPPTWHWNGHECVPIECGACEGTDCRGAPRSRAECEAAHASCEAALCERTGGEWLWWADECDHFVCGLSTSVDCLVGGPICDCGPRRRFDPALGCVETTCPEVDPLPPDVLCRATGGEWGGFCCNSICGEPCLLPCTELACHCPDRTHVFDPVRGCVPGRECFERELGRTCSGGARCSAGTICCQRCDASGCTGEPTCIEPVCDGDPRTDECGNALPPPDPPTT